MIEYLRNLFLKDFWLKLFSFALAVLLWFIIYFARDFSPGTGTPLTMVTEKRTIAQLPVDILSSAEDVRSFRVNPKEVEVTVQGDPRILNRLRPKEIRVLVDLTGISAAHDLRKRIEVSTPPGVTYVRIYPEEVQVIFPPRS
ncbi:MAG TPA: CdaR family protein [Clostridia bacterium]|nr:CdaR family protein [Clostridia bacterium]